MAAEIAPAPADDAPLMFKARRPAKTSQVKRPQPVESDSESSSDESSGDSSDEQSKARSSKRRKLGGGIQTQPSSLSKDLSVPTEELRPVSDPSALDEKALLRVDESPVTTPPASSKADGLYTMPAKPTSFIPKNPNAAPSKFGPQKAAPSNVRMVTFTDYAPDVCKDYKQTGYCGFGDSCKFLHAREDYAAGWALDRDWEISQRAKKSGKESSDTTRAEDKELGEIPFACLICKGPYKNPIVTKCGHYFCEACALKRYKKEPGCQQCGEGTNGVFNNAKQLKRLLERKVERDKQKQEGAEEGK